MRPDCSACAMHSATVGIMIIMTGIFVVTLFL
jgi:hypothetical protein